MCDCWQTSTTTIGNTAADTVPVQVPLSVAVYYLSMLQCVSKSVVSEFKLGLAHSQVEQYIQIMNAIVSVKKENEDDMTYSDRLPEVISIIKNAAILGVCSSQ